MGLLSRLTGRRHATLPGSADLGSREHKANPFPFYARLRAEEPVHRFLLPDRQTAWLLSRYDDAVALFKDERFAKDNLNALTPEQRKKLPWVPKMFRPLMRSMIVLDAPDHTRLRSLVNKAFSPHLVEKLRTRVETLANRLLDRMAKQRQINLIRDYALPIPMTVIAEMLGVPEADRPGFDRWSRAVVEAKPTLIGMVLLIPRVWSFLRFIRRLVKAKRAAPTDDLLSALVQAEEAGNQLTEDELVAMAFLLLVAGHETTVNLIANGVLALLDHPDELGRLRSDPSLIKPAVEEMLRYGSPLELTSPRFAREELSIGGVTIRQGEQVFAGILSANRDEKQFPDADRLILTREPNRHLSFGLGSHFCVGAPLARMEAQVAINGLLRRAEDLRLSIPRAQLQWRRGMIFRGVESLPLSVDRWQGN